MADIHKMTPEQLEALAAKRRRAQQADIVHLDREVPTTPDIQWPRECEVGGVTFHLVPELSDDWDFQQLLTEFGRSTQDNDSVKTNKLAPELIAYMYEEPLDEIMETLRALHPEDRRPHVHTEDIAALIEGGVPKAS